MRNSICRRVTAAFILIATLLSIPAHAGDQLELKKKFLSPIKYSLNGQKPRNIYTFSGMDIQPHFKKIISRYPEAYKEIKVSYTYNGIALAGSAVMLLGAILQLSNTLEEAKDVNSGNLPNNSYDSSPLLLVLGGAVLSVVGGTIAGNHLRKCVKIYNSKQKDLSEKENTTGFNIFFKPEIRRNQPGLSATLCWNW